jgi:hypothetical protein
MPPNGELFTSSRIAGLAQAKGHVFNQPWLKDFSNKISGQNGYLPLVCGLANIESPDFGYLLASFQGQRWGAT